MRGRTIRRWATALVCVALGVGAIATAPLPGAPLTHHLTTLADLPDDNVDDYLMRHPDVLIDVLSSQPDDIAVWWSTLAKQDRRELFDLAPQVIGNLGGIDYATRDRANRVHLAKALAEAKTKPQLVGASGTVSDLAALTAISKAVAGKRIPKRYLVTLSTSSPPLAAVAIGDLDTAQQITFAVPGMGSFSNDMVMWSQAAQNVWNEQGPVGADERAVVAWIGYVAPPEGIDAAVGEYAASGSPRLIGDLRAVRAVRDGGKDVGLSVVAHSYGSTMAANALYTASDLGVFSFVMLGSAGVEQRIGKASRIHARHVYAGEASDDPLAHWGRASRIDPRSPSFGAIVLAVDGDPARGLLPVTVHAPVIHSSWNDDPTSTRWRGLKTPTLRLEFEEHSATFGYFDPGTESLRNTAIVTTPRSHTRPILAR